MSVYDKSLGGWTEQSRKLSEEVNDAVKDILSKYYDEGMTVEEVSYVVNRTVEEELLFKRIEERLRLKEWC